MIRSVRPTDFASFLAFLRKGNTNDAKTGRNLGRRDRRLLSVGRFFQDWLSLDENRYTFIDITRGHIRGFISVRSRPSPSSWQVDTLIMSPRSDCQDICLRLLEYVSAVGGENGIHKIFLRVDKESHLSAVTRQAGFLPYKAELLYGRAPQAAEGPAPTDSLVRPKRPGDDLHLFHLYSATVPGHVREAEAMTFDEWKAITKKHLGLYSQQDLVMEKDGALVGWIRLRQGRQDGFFDILASPQQKDVIDTLLTHGLATLDPRRPVYCLLPEYRDDLRHAVEQRGLKLVGEYSSLVKQLAVRIRQPRFAPARI